MTPDALSPDSAAFAAAFDAAAGRTAPDDASRAAPPVAVVALARRLVATGRLIAGETPCPRPWIRRAEAIFSTRRGALGRTRVGALWALLFDSAAGAVPATRGTDRTRFVRVGGEGGSLEAELSGVGTDDVRLVGALVAHVKAPVVVLEPEKGKPVRARVGDGGVFELRVPGTATSFTLAVRTGRTLVARSAPIVVARPRS